MLTSWSFRPCGKRTLFLVVAKCLKLEASSWHYQAQPHVNRLNAMRLSTGINNTGIVSIKEGWQHFVFNKKSNSLPAACKLLPVRLW